MPDTGLKDAEHGWCPVGGFPTTEQGYLKVVSVDEEGHKTVACPVCNRDLAMKVHPRGWDLGVSRHKLLRELAQEPQGPSFDQGNGKPWGKQGEGELRKEEKTGIDLKVGVRLRDGDKWPEDPGLTERLEDAYARLESLEGLIVDAMQAGQTEHSTVTALLPDIWQEIRAIKKGIPDIA